MINPIIRISYSFHNELLEITYLKMCLLFRFQKTMGYLKLYALIAWQC